MSDPVDRPSETPVPGGKPIFLDASGRRAARTRWTAAVVAVVAALVLAGFVASLVVLPRLTQTPWSNTPYSGHVDHSRKAARALLTRIAHDDRRRVAPVVRAGVIAGTRIVKVAGKPYSPEALKAAITAAAKPGALPILLSVKADDRVRLVRVPYHLGPRYPALKRLAETPDRLGQILSPR